MKTGNYIESQNMVEKRKKRPEGKEEKEAHVKHCGEILNSRRKRGNGTYI